MDTTGIIQLIIATIFYSTLVAPNIKKMSDLRSEISDMHFPLKSDASYGKMSKDLGTSINKKMKQYEAIYNETRKFLWVLYIAMAVVLLSQVVPVLYEWIVSGHFQFDTLAGSLITFTIFALLIIAMRIFILRPDQIRTFEWLSSVGIAQTYSHDIFSPSLETNQVARNLRESNNHVNVNIAADMILYGYSIIFTIEDVAGEKIYHVVAGRVQKKVYLGISGNYYPNGKSRAILDLVHSLRLRPGHYKTRLLIFETVFPGNRKPTEVRGSFEVTETVATDNIVDIDLNVVSKNYSFKSEKNAPCNIDFLYDFKDGDAIRMLLSSPRFRKHFSKTKVLFSLTDHNGMLTYDSIHKALHPVRIFVRTFARTLRKRSAKKSRYGTHVNLT